MIVKTRNPFILSALAAVSLATAGLSVAQTPYPPPPPSVDLSAEQKNRLRSVMDDTRKDLGNLYRRLHNTRKELSRIFDTYDLDERRARELIRQMNDTQNEISARHLQAQKDIRHIVTASQFEQLKKFMGPLRPHGGPDGRPGHPKDPR